VEEQAEAARHTIDRLLEMRNQFIDLLKGNGARGVAVDLAGDLIGYPILAVSDVVGLYGVSYPTANTAVDRLVRMGLLREITGGHYGRIFRCDLVYAAIAAS
ncbi:MAG: hypothetical protein WB770_11135, partial [Acidimicrobiales bacterium]